MFWPVWPPYVRKQRALHACGAYEASPSSFFNSLKIVLGSVPKIYMKFITFHGGNCLYFVAKQFIRVFACYCNFFQFKSTAGKKRRWTLLIVSGRPVIRTKLEPDKELSEMPPPLLSPSLPALSRLQPRCFTSVAGLLVLQRYARGAIGQTRMAEWVGPPLVATVIPNSHKNSWVDLIIVQYIVK
jgi:hypothetical protein